MYTLMDHISVFGSAETGNMLVMLKNLFLGDFFHFALRLGGVAIYVFGIICSLLIAEKLPKYQKLISVTTDVAAALVLPFFPAHTDPVVSIYPVAFAMSMQWCTFSGVGGNVCATTFSTNNLRQFVSAAFRRIVKGDKNETFKMLFYLFTLIMFHTGAAVVCLLWKKVSDFSIWIALVPLTAALVVQLKSQ